MSGRVFGFFDRSRKQLKRTLFKVSGLAAERDAYARQRDIALTERDSFLRQRDEVAGERNAFLRQRDEVVGERNAFLRQRDEAIGERNELLRQRDEALGERNEFLRQRDEALGERNEFLRQRDEAIDERDEFMRQRDEVRYDATSPGGAMVTSSGRSRLADILAVARQNLSAAVGDPTDGLPDPGPRWGTIAAWCREKIPTFRTAVEAIHFAQVPTRHGGFESRPIGEALAKFAADRERQISEAFPSLQRHLRSFDEPELSHQLSTMTYNGRRVSGPMYTHMAVFFHCATRIPRMNAVCEIGGGYGAPARLFLTNSYRRPNSYVIVDLPESLFFAEVYLRATLGNDRVHYLQQGETADTSRHEVMLCPVSRLAALRPVHFDLVLNTLSMQEMTDDYVAFYRDWIDVQLPDYFYSFNYFMQDAAYLGESGNLLAPRLSAKWSVAWSLCIAYKPQSFLHVLAQRTPLRISHSIARPLPPASLYPLLHAADARRAASLRADDSTGRGLRRTAKRGAVPGPLHRKAGAPQACLDRRRNAAHQGDRGAHQRQARRQHQRPGAFPFG